MASIFISYGDDRFKVSLNRLIRQARKSGLFDRVIKYTPKDLPEYVRSSPLFSETMGGGCWCWKPYIIANALSNCEIGDVVYYADAGCTLVAESPEWEEFKLHLLSYSAIFFQYRRGFSYPGWNKYFKNDATDKTAIKHWMKPALIEYFKRYDNPTIFDFDSLWAGFVIFKKQEQPSIILKQWLNISLLLPALVYPPFGAEMEALPDSYYAHRCNQGILSPLVCHYQDQDRALVLPETSESLLGSPAILATRWRQAKLPFLKYLKYRLYELIHKQ